MLAIGSDHAGYELKCEVKKFLDGLGVALPDNLHVRVSS